MLRLCFYANDSLTSTLRIYFFAIHLKSNFYLVVDRYHDRRIRFCKPASIGAPRHRSLSRGDASACFTRIAVPAGLRCTSTPLSRKPRCEPCGDASVPTPLSYSCGCETDQDHDRQHAYESDERIQQGRSQPHSSAQCAPLDLRRPFWNTENGQCGSRSSLSCERKGDRCDRLGEGQTGWIRASRTSHGHSVGETRCRLDLQ